MWTPSPGRQNSQNSKHSRSNSTSIARRIALQGILIAVAIVLNIAESFIPIFYMLPGFKLGLSNIVALFALQYVSVGAGLTVAVTKSLFVLVTRGGSAFLMSLVGGLAAVGAMLIFLQLIDRIGYGKMSAVSVCVAGAVVHNLGQLAVVAVYTKMSVVVYYLPFLIVAGVMMGIVTGVLYSILDKKVFKREGTFKR